MTSETTHPDLFRGSDPRVFSTAPDQPEDGRTFVYAEARWYERMEDEESGAVEFSPVADSEQYLREWLREGGLELDELDAQFEFTRDVRDAFLNQLPLYPEAAEDSDQPINMEQTLPTPDELGDLSSSDDDSLPAQALDNEIDVDDVAEDVVRGNEEA